jgi:hypothetical protein
MGARLAVALDALCAAGYALADVERRLGLSRGYLRQCTPQARRPKTPARPLLLLLELLAHDPALLDRCLD